MLRSYVKITVHCKNLVFMAAAPSTAYSVFYTYTLKQRITDQTNNYYIILHYTILYIILYYIILYYIILYNSVANIHKGVMATKT